MPTLSSRDLEALLDLVRSLHDQDLGTLPRHCVATVRTLIGADVATYSDFDVRESVALEATDPDGVVTASGQEAFERHMHEHPLIAHYARTGDGRALKSSDFLSQSELTRLGLYNEYIKPFFGTRYQIAIAVSAHRSRVIGISLARARRDFSERERQMLNALRPHLTQAVRHAETASKLPALSERSDEPESERQLVAIDLGGQIRSTTVTAETWLRQFFGRARSAHRLPEPVWRWVESRIRGRSHLDGTWDTGETLVARTPGARLTLRCVVRERGLFVMLEYDDPLRDALKLADLGLTPREIEILRWVAEGKATRDIAIIVGCSIRTAHKHLERIYRKLDVENRTAAAAVVRGLRRLDHSGP